MDGEDVLEMIKNDDKWLQELNPITRIQKYDKQKSQYVSCPKSGAEMLYRNIILGPKVIFPLIEKENRFTFTVFRQYPATHFYQIEYVFPF